MVNKNDNQRLTHNSEKRKVANVKHGYLETEKKRQIERNRQVTRGYNIVADEWASAFNPHPHAHL